MTLQYNHAKLFNLSLETCRLMDALLMSPLTLLPAVCKRQRPLLLAVCLGILICQLVNPHHSQGSS